MKPTLRPYQARAVAAVLAARDAGTRRLILVAPTGAGKTEMASALIDAVGGHALFLVHRLELVEQAAARFERHGMHAGIIQGTTPPDSSAPVQVASVQSLARRERPPADLVVTDEAHHAAAESFAHILDAYPDAFHVGITATPYRLDGRGLGTIFQKILVAAHPRELVELGYLVQPRIYTAPPPDLTGIRKVGGDYAVAALSDRMVRLAGRVVESWQRLAQDRRTVVFAVDIAHSEALRDAFRGAGIAAEHFDGGDDRETRRGVLERFAAGTTRVLSNCSLISEGFDLPEIGVVQMARPTASRALYKQQVGRAMRPVAGKTDCILLDNAGNFGRFGDPLDLEEYSLTSEVRVPDPVPTRTCRGCFAVLPRAATRCPYCGFEAEVQPRTVRETDEELVAVASVHARYAAMGMDERVAIYRGLLTDAQGYGFKPGWAAFRYRSKFGIWPEPAVMARAEAGTKRPIEALADWLGTATERGYKPGWAAWRFKTIYGRWPSAREKAEAAQCQ